MRIRNFKIITVGCVLAVLSQLACKQSLAASDPGQVIPQGALAHATMALEEQTSGKVLEIRLADEKGAPVFEAAIKKGDDIIYMRIASVSDDTTEVEIAALPPWMQTYKLEAYMRSIDKAKVPLADAIMRAEKRYSAPAIGAGIAKPLGATNAVLAFYVETMKGSKRELTAVSAETGAFIANPEALYEPFTPVKLARRLAP